MVRIIIFRDFVVRVKKIFILFWSASLKNLGNTDLTQCFSNCVSQNITSVSNHIQYLDEKKWSLSKCTCYKSRWQTQCFIFFSWYMISIISHKHFIQFSKATYIYIVCQSILLVKKIMFCKKSLAFKGSENWSRFG